MFADEFNGGSIDSARWTRGRYGEGITNGVNKYQKDCFSSENVWVSGGAAQLRVEPKPSTCQNGSQPNTGAFLTTDGKYGLGYGYFEARIKTSNGTNVWPAWWLTADPWPNAIEVDILETDGDDEADFNVHYACGSANRDGSCNINGQNNTVSLGATQDFHVYAAEVTPGGVTWYFDGRKVGSWSGRVPDVKRALIFDHKSFNGRLQKAHILYVDYVRAWSR
ncbi:MAG: glycoside hydrolase family 16 protein [Austwickia sp.]|nr:glycoside hydrolase family 16 protein [Austwickia sp.]